MPKTLTIKLNVAGTDTGPYDLYAYNLSTTTPEFQNITRDQLIYGYLCEFPNDTTIIRIQSIGLCNNYIDLNVDCP